MVRLFYFPFFFLFFFSFFFFKTKEMVFKIWVVTSEFQNYADHSVWFLFSFFGSLSPYCFGRCQLFFYRLAFRRLKQALK